MHRLVASCICALALLSGLAAVSAATTPQDVTINVTKPLGDSTPGTFTASGGIADSGGYLQSDFHDTAIPSPVIGTLHYTATFSGTNGTFTVDINSSFGFVAPGPVLEENGPWLITGGTGAYAGVHGEGKLHKIIDVPAGAVTITFEGQVH